MFIEVKVLKEEDIKKTVVTDFVRKFVNTNFIVSIEKTSVFVEYGRKSFYKTKIKFSDGTCINVIGEPKLKNGDIDIVE